MGWRKFAGRTINYLANSYSFRYKQKRSILNYIVFVIISDNMFFRPDYIEATKAIKSTSGKCLQNIDAMENLLF